MKQISKQLNQYIHWNEFYLPGKDLFDFSKTSFSDYRKKINSLISDTPSNPTQYLWESTFKFYGFEDILLRLEKQKPLLNIDNQKQILEYTFFTNHLSAKIFDYIIVTSLSEARMSNQFKDLYDKLETKLTENNPLDYLYKASDSTIKELFNSDIKLIALDNIKKNHQKLPHISEKKISILYEQLLYTWIKDATLDRDEIQDFWIHPSTSIILKQLTVKDILDITHELLDPKDYNSGFGGKFWQEIVQHAIKFCTGEINANTFIDQSFSMEHNSGSMFNKNYLFKQFTKNNSYLYSINIFDKNMKETSFIFHIDEIILNAQRHSSVLTLLQKYEPITPDIIKKAFPKHSLKNKEIILNSFNSMISTLNTLADDISSKIGVYLNKNKIQFENKHILNFSKIFFNDLDYLERSYGTNSITWAAIEHTYNFFESFEHILLNQKKDPSTLNFSMNSLAELSHSNVNRDTLGNKGYGLVEMKKLNIPVPNAFIIDTETNQSFFNSPKEIIKKLSKSYDTKISKEFDLFSVRSGASISMPGLLDTILNLGIDDESYHKLCSQYTKKVIDECAISFMQSFSKSLFNTIIHTKTLSNCITKFSKLLKDNNIPHDENTIFPLNTKNQFLLACKGIFNSSTKTMVREWCLTADIPAVSTAIIIQKMILGNRNYNSLTGVIFSRNCTTGEDNIWGEYLVKQQGEQLVSGKTMAKNIKDLSNDNPKIYQQLTDISQKLEHHFQAVQDIEFTVENDQLFILQTRNAKISANAQKKLLKLGKHHLISQQIFDKFSTIENNQPNIKGLPIGNGALTGIIVTNEKDLVKYQHLKTPENKWIFYANQALPEHLPMLLKTDAIITKEGGMTSHAAILARNLKKPAISGISQHFNPGQIISLDATNGFIWYEPQSIISPNTKDHLKIAKNILNHYEVNLNDFEKIKPNFLQTMQSWYIDLNNSSKKTHYKKHFFQLMERGAILVINQNLSKQNRNKI